MTIHNLEGFLKKIKFLKNDAVSESDLQRFYI